MSKNCARSIFPLACLPTDVLYIVSGYLSPKDKGRFARISKYFRRFFESSHLWQNVTICVKSTELKTSVFILKMIQKRKIKSIEFAVFDVKLFRIISTILPQLESLSLQKTSSSKGEMANALKSFSVCTQLRSLTIRDTTGRSSSLESMFAVRKFLTSLFELEYITLMEINLLEVQYHHGGDAEGGGGVKVKNPHHNILQIPCRLTVGYLDYVMVWILDLVQPRIMRQVSGTLIGSLNLGYQLIYCVAIYGN